MSARHWMIGCLIGLAGVGGAAAADLGAHEIGGSTGHSAAGNCARDAGGNNGGDTLGLGRDCSSSRRGSDADNSDAGSHANGAMGGGEHDNRISAPVAAKPAMLGWQSLLPGSIQ